MNTYNVNDINFVNSNLYQNYLKDNPSKGYLKIRAYAANEAIPIKGLRVIVSKIIDDNNVIFFDGVTNDSGVIEKITLPTPKSFENDLVVPTSTIYDINTIYEPDKLRGKYQVSMFENVYVVQTIGIVPKMNRIGGI